MTSELAVGSRHEGYRQAGYAQSLSQFGHPRALEGAGTWILERAIPDAGGPRDAIGCYPILACRDWGRLPGELEELESDLVSMSFVSDPFADLDVTWMREWLDVARPFKEHLVLDLSLNADAIVTRHHRYYTRKALRTVSVEISERPLDHAREWTGLYAHLIERHQIEGIRSFSPAAFEAQLALDGMVMLRCLEEGEAIAAHLWLLQDDVAYSHLAASTPRGYEVGAAYAIYDRAISHFQGKASWVNFGSGTEPIGAPADGLAKFKRGWSSGTRTAYLCGKILQPSLYQELSRGIDTSFFPAYRQAL